MKKIYLIKLKGDTHYAICTSSVQYGYDLENPLFKYENVIFLKRQVNRKEAELLLELVQHNGTGSLCAGPCESIYELTADDDMIEAIIERKRQGIDCNEFESANIKGFIREHIDTMASPKIVQMANDIKDLFPIEYAELFEELNRD
jgi:hypothetical protein